MSSIFMKPQRLLSLISEKNSKGLKLFNVGMGSAAKDDFYIRSIPSANLINLSEFTEPHPNM
jgi:hypothetical protein